MNEVFCSILQKFVLVFFGDILVYSKHWDEHLQHLCHVFTITFPSFGSQPVQMLDEYVRGNIFGPCNLSIWRDRSKIQAIVDWPTPTSVIVLREFLGLAGYYRKFIRAYGQISAPLNNLLKRNEFTWSDIATSTFENLKTALSSAQVLQLPNFDELFVIECDASGGGIGTVLQ
ncbi:uncharacterized mitochondrial protein AtMg00860-like [Aristolochia californica]|uniref:uncharacterized mitochondrial protein AtMg00860-like n=1 Tax=Aristolochia californica TaxID=171875 RepID=UPI0035E0101A